MMYKTIEHMIPKHTRTKMVSLIDKKISAKAFRSHPADAHEMLSDIDVSFNSIQMSILPKIEEAFGVSLVPTYNYSRVYYYGGLLPRHKDRPSCEYSVTVNLQQEGMPWPIFMQEDGKDPEAVYLNPSDAAVYKGCDVWHWREENDHGKCYQIFFHYVEKDGPNMQWAYDKDEKYYFSCLQQDKIMIE
jgi:hypothetical protein